MSNNTFGALAPFVPGNSIAPQTKFNVDTPAGGTKHPAIKYKTPIFTREDGKGETARIGIDKIDVVILGTQPGGQVTRSYYASSTPKEGEKPLCSSNDGLAPSSYASVAQSQGCKACRWAQRGTAQDGKSAACSIKQRIAVVVIDPADPELNVHSMYIPSTSLFGTSDVEHAGKYNLIGYLKFLASNGYNAAQVVTRIEANAAKSANFNAVTFMPVSVLSQAQADILGTDERIAAVKEITVITEQQRAQTPTPPVQQPTQQPAQPSGAASVLAAMGIPVPPGTDADAMLNAVLAMRAAQQAPVQQPVQQPAVTTPAVTTVTTPIQQPVVTTPAGTTVTSTAAKSPFDVLGSNVAKPQGEWG